MLNLTVQRFNDVALSPAAFFAFVLLSLAPVFPRLEDNLFPVMSKVELSPLPSAPGQTRFQVQYDKRRQCSLTNLLFYRDTARLRSRPEVSKPPSEDTGVHSEVWVLDGTFQPAELRAVARYRCHVFWDGSRQVFP